MEIVEKRISIINLEKINTNPIINRIMEEINQILKTIINSDISLQVILGTLVAIKFFFSNEGVSGLDG